MAKTTPRWDYTGESRLPRGEYTRESWRTGGEHTGEFQLARDWIHQGVDFLVYSEQASQQVYKKILTSDK